MSAPRSTRLVYQVERAEDAPADRLPLGDLTRQMQYGIRENPGGLTLEEFSTERARDFRAKHAYEGGAFLVIVWRERPGEHYRQAPPEDATVTTFGADWPEVPRPARGSAPVGFHERRS